MFHSASSAHFVVGHPVRLDLLGRQVRGDVDWDFGQAKLQSGHEPRVADDDHAVGIDNDRLPPTEFLQARRDAGHRFVVDPRIAFIRLDLPDGPHLDLHRSPPCGRAARLRPMLSVRGEHLR